MINVLRTFWRVSKVKEIDRIVKTFNIGKKSSFASRLKVRLTKFSENSSQWWVQVIRRYPVIFLKSNFFRRSLYHEGNIHNYCKGTWNGSESRFSDIERRCAKYENQEHRLSVRTFETRNSRSSNKSTVSLWWMLTISYSISKMKSQVLSRFESRNASLMIVFLRWRQKLVNQKYFSYRGSKIVFVLRIFFSIWKMTSYV